MGNRIHVPFAPCSRSLLTTDPFNNVVVISSSLRNLPYRPPSFLRQALAQALRHLSFLFAAAGLGLSQASDIQIELVASGLSSPVAIANAGDSRLFVTERVGRIRILTFDAQGQATLLPASFLDISSIVLSGGERGLLSTAFHPDYASNAFFYVNYTCESSAQAECQDDGDTIIARYSVTADPDVADPGAAVILAAIPQDFGNHNGGQLKFEPFPVPEDNRTLLYIGMGDGGSGNDPNNRAQDLNSLLGKILRVDVDNLNAGLPRYNIPNDNPFSDEIWAFGVRNPWRFSFDRQTGDMFIADVGQNQREEVDFQPAASIGGENYGWRPCEGTRRNIEAEAPPTCEDGTGGLVPPVLEYTHDDGCSVTGGYVYRGSEFDLHFGGTYFYGDFCSQRIWGARKQTDGTWANIIDHVAGAGGITSFGEDQDGELYFAVISGGIYRIKPLSTLLPDLTVTMVAGPPQGEIGESIVISSVEVQNLGQAKAGQSRVGFYFTTDPVGQPDQTFSESLCRVPLLDIGETHTCADTDVKLPLSLVPGSQRLVAIVDDIQAVAESDENNNATADPNSIDLIVCVDPQDENCIGDLDESNPPAACTPTEGPEMSCNDREDNDCDGLIDSADPDCPCMITEVFEVGASCTDKLDNDCDGLIDLEDPGCQGR